jgi:hypothetical protein
MDIVRTKADIWFHIVDHQQLSMLGGISPSSQLYIDFTQRQDEILAAFSLEPTRENKRLLFRYPFSCSIDPRRVPREELTDKLCIKLMLDWGFNGSKDIGFHGGAVKFGTTSDKADFILKNLLRKAEQNLNS